LSDYYARLRSIGCSVETADALAPILAGIPKRKAEAFLLWAMGVPEKQIGEMCGMHERTVRKIIEAIRAAYTL
jgi:DNA-directed RNA polymerase specialized sigma24 family protein